MKMQLCAVISFHTDEETDYGTELQGFYPFLKAACYVRSEFQNLSG